MCVRRHPSPVSFTILSKRVPERPRPATSRVRWSSTRRLGSATGPSVLTYVSVGPQTWCRTGARSIPNLSGLASESADGCEARTSVAVAADIYSRCTNNVVDVFNVSLNISFFFLEIRLQNYISYICRRNVLVRFSNARRSEVSKKNKNASRDTPDGINHNFFSFYFKHVPRIRFWFSFEDFRSVYVYAQKFSLV